MVAAMARANFMVKIRCMEAEINGNVCKWFFRGAISFWVNRRKGFGPSLAPTERYKQVI